MSVHFDESDKMWEDVHKKFERAQYFATYEYDRVEEPAAKEYRRVKGELEREYHRACRFAFHQYSLVRGPAWKKRELALESAEAEFRRECDSIDRANEERDREYEGGET
jgi:hypothetical protein